MTRAELAIAIPVTDLINTNAHENCFVQAKKRKVLRAFVKEAATGLGRIEAPARGVITFVWADRVRRDPDNYETKAIWDGLVDAGILDDDNGQVLRATVRIAAPWRHDLGRGIVVLGVKVQALGDGVA